MQLDKPVARLIALHQQAKAQVGNKRQKGLHRAVTGEQHQHPFVLALFIFRAEIGRHLGEVRLFMLHQRLMAQARDHKFALLNMIKRRIERHEAVACFIAQAAHLLQPREAVQRTQRGGGHHHVRHLPPDEFFELIADANAHAVEENMRLPFAGLARHPFRDRRAGGVRQRGEPPELALRFKVAERAVHLQQHPVQTHDVMAAGFFAEIV